MPRPKSDDKLIIHNRNRFIMMAIADGLPQADVARMFRIPRNTVFQVIKKQCVHIPIKRNS